MVVTMKAFRTQQKLVEKVTNLQNMLGTGAKHKKGPYGQNRVLSVLVTSDTPNDQTRDNLFYKSFCKKEETESGLAGNGAVSQYKFFGDNPKQVQQKFVA